MTIHFRSKKSPGLGAVLLISGALILFLLFGLPVITNSQNNSYVLLIKIVFSFFLIGSLSWYWTGTNYTIENNSVIIKSGPFRWNIPIQDISVIQLDHNMISGNIKPALSWKCMEIDYGRGKTISISPDDQDRFLKSLKEINKEINIKYSS